MKIRTVTIDRDGVPVRINETAYDPERHKVWHGPQPASKEPEAPEAVVKHSGGGWYQVLQGGEVISGEEKVRKAEAEAIAEEANRGG